MPIGYIVVRNPRAWFVPRWATAFHSEQYLRVDLEPDFTNDYAAARVFPSYKWADSYVRDRDARVRPGMDGAVVRAVNRAHNIPQGDKNETS